MPAGGGAGAGGGASRAQIQRANAEEFIHIFVNNAQKLTEFLEHMVAVRSLSFSTETNLISGFSDARNILQGYVIRAGLRLVLLMLQH